MANTALRRGSQEEGNSDYFTGCPIGGGFMWFGLPTKIPVNCRVCDNTTLAIADFAKLHENLGGAWGTSGANLNIPDLRGRFPRGVDGGAGKDPGGRTPANTGGNTGDAVGSVQDDAMQGHFHTLGGQYNTADAAANPANYLQSSATGGAPLTATLQNNNYIASPKSDGTNGTPRTDLESRPKNANVYFVIRVS